MVKEFQRTGPLTDIDSYPAWAKQLMDATNEKKLRAMKHDLFVMMRDGMLSEQHLRNFLLAGWPVIEQFPQYMAVNLCKIRYGRSRGESQVRQYLLHNIRVEQNHANHWVDWAVISGVKLQDLLGDNAPVESLALRHRCWYSCERYSLATSTAATNFAIEGATGEWSTLVCSTDAYEMSFNASVRRKAMR